MNIRERLGMRSAQEQESVSENLDDVVHDDEQPAPTPNRYPAIQDLVIRDMERRKAIGISRYGTTLQPFNGRDPLRDLYEELIDACNYIRQIMYERDGT